MKKQSKYELKKGIEKRFPQVNKSSPHRNGQG